MITFDDIIEKQKKSDTGFTQHYLWLYTIIKSMECDNVLEFGHGFSTQVILKALNDNNKGKLLTLDKKEKENISHNKNIKWQYIKGDSTQTFNQIAHPFYEVILHDGSHIASEVEIDLKNCLPYLKYNSILLVHDTMHPTLKEDMQYGVKQALSGRKFEVITIPYGYGLTVIVWKENKENKINLKWSKI